MPACYRLQVIASERTISPQTLVIETVNLTCELIDSKLYTVKATGVWLDNFVPKNSIIHVIDPVIDDKILYVSSARGLLVVEPDHLLTCTIVASTLFCERKSWLSYIFSGAPGTSKPMLIGTLVHEVFQFGVKNRIDDINKLIKFLDEQLLDDATVMLECYSVESDLNEIRNEVIEYAKSVSEWIRKYMLIGPPYLLENDVDHEVKLIGVTDIEENVWSTKYGFKGKIDVTGTVRLHNKVTNKTSDLILPLELKTGRPQPSMSHQAQVSLYSLMIEDRYKETNKGLLIYLKNRAAMFKVDLDYKVKRDLIQRRNSFSYHTKDSYFGPEMKDDANMCSRCDSLSECVLMSEIYNPGNIDSYPTMKELKNEAMGHLSLEFRKFFDHYHKKLTILLKSYPTPEASDNSQSQITDECSQSRYFWTYSSQEAESKKIGYGKLKASFRDGDDKVVIFTRNLKRRLSSDSEFSEEESQERGDSIRDKFCDFEEVSKARVAVSKDSYGSMKDSNSSTALLIGYIQSVTQNQIVFKVYEGSVDIIRGMKRSMFRIDRLNRRPQLDIERSILIRLVQKENWRVDNIRRLLVDPSFKPDSDSDFSLFVLSQCFEYVTQLDSKFQKYVTESICTDNYYIVEKTNRYNMINFVNVFTRMARDLSRNTLIVAENIDELVDLMTNLRTHKVPFKIIDDSSSKVARFKFATNLIKVPQDTDLSLSDKYNTYIKQHELAGIIITTYPMSYAGLFFLRRVFDYCIMFDCNSIELLMGLCPLFCSNRWIILAGEGETLVREMSSPMSSQKQRLIDLRDETLQERLILLDRL